MRWSGPQHKTQGVSCDVCRDDVCILAHPPAFVAWWEGTVGWTVVGAWVVTTLVVSTSRDSLVHWAECPCYEGFRAMRSACSSVTLLSTTHHLSTAFHGWARTGASSRTTTIFGRPPYHDSQRIHSQSRSGITTCTHVNIRYSL